MRNRAGRALAFLAAAGLLTACASNEPYTPTQAQPSYRLPRTPVVAPAGPLSPWWWPAPETWWPFAPMNR